MDTTARPKGVRYLEVPLYLVCNYLVCNLQLGGGGGALTMDIKIWGGGARTPSAPMLPPPLPCIWTLDFKAVARGVLCMAMGSEDLPPSLQTN